MKHLKIYEELNNTKPKIGDYVICKDYLTEVYNFVLNNIGQIIDIVSNYHGDQYVIKFENIPENIKNWFYNYNNDRNTRSYDENEILYFSNNKEDLEIILQTKKYNL